MTFPSILLRNFQFNAEIAIFTNYVFSEKLMQNVHF